MKPSQWRRLHIGLSTCPNGFKENGGSELPLREGIGDRTAERSIDLMIRDGCVLQSAAKRRVFRVEASGLRES